MSLDQGFEKFKKWRFVPEFVIIAFMFAFINMRIGFWYETNDDYILNGMLAGWFTGTPSFRTIYGGFFYVFPLKCLYDLFPKVAWYGLGNLFLYVITCFGILNRITAGAKNVAGYIYRLAISCSVLGIMFRINTLFQYTTLGIIVAALGFVILIVGGGRKRDYIAFFLCELLAYGVRPESMGIVQIIGFMTLFVIKLRLSLIAKKPVVKFTVGRVLPALLISVCIILVGKTADRMIYNSPEWQQALRTNSARASWFDYHLSPEADEISEILEKNNITEEEYYAYRYYLNYGWDNSSDLITDVNEYLEKRDTRSADPVAIIKSVFLGSSLDWGLSKITLLVFAFTLFLAIINKSILDIAAVSILEISKLMAWGYLYYIGRFPVRVMLPMAICHIIMLLLISLTAPANDHDEKNYVKYFKSGVIALFAVAFILASGKSFILQYRNCANAANGMRIMEDTKKDIISYCNEKPDSRFIMAPAVYSYWGQAALYEKENAGNFILGGGWFMSSPEAQEHVSEYLESGKEIYYVSVGGDFQIPMEKHLEYFKKIQGYDPKLVEEKLMPSGATYLIYRLK